MPAMLKFEYCKPVLAKAVPTGPDWIHEVKYDGYRGRIVRDGKVVKLLSKRARLGWRFPLIVETALKMKQPRFIIDGEICVLDVQGSPTSTPCIPTGITTKPSSMPSTWSRSTATTARPAAVRPQGPVNKLLERRVQGIFKAPS